MESIVLPIPRSLRKRAISRSIAVIVLMAFFSWFGFSTAQASTVYVLLGGNATSDASVIDALSAGGHVVTAGVQTTVWDGTQANLNEYPQLSLQNRPFMIPPKPAIRSRPRRLSLTLLFPPVASLFPFWFASFAVQTSPRARDAGVDQASRSRRRCLRGAFPNPQRDDWK